MTMTTREMMMMTMTREMMMTVVAQALRLKLLHPTNSRTLMDLMDLICHFVWKHLMKQIFGSRTFTVVTNFKIYLVRCLSPRLPFALLASLGPLK
jgi:hypothetical protein